MIAGLAPGTDGAAVQRDLERRSDHAVDTELVSDEVRQERADIRPIVFGSSALLIAVGLVNLLTTLLLVTRERARDFGILKAIGPDAARRARGRQRRRRGARADRDGRRASRSGS